MNMSWRMYSWSLVALALFALLCTGCHEAARTATRNMAEMGKVLAQHSDNDVASMGRVLTVEAEAVADDYDAMMWGLWNNRSKPSVTEQHLKADLQAALEANVRLTQELKAETSAKIELGNWLEGLVITGLALLTGGGAATATAIKYRSQIKTLSKVVVAGVKFGYAMTQANTEDEAEVVKKIAKAEQKAEGIHDIVADTLESIRADAEAKKAALANDKEEDKA